MHRYSIAPNVKTITLVMSWLGADRPVTFRQYNGSYNLNDLPATADRDWTTAVDQNRFIPATACERFHLNFWMGNFDSGNAGANPPPKTMPYEIVINNFEFAPPKR